MYACVVEYKEENEGTEAGRSMREEKVDRYCQCVYDPIWKGMNE